MKERHPGEDSAAVAYMRPLGRWLTAGAAGRGRRFGVAAGLRASCRVTCTACAKCLHARAFVCVRR